jgi:hypothetical protein
MTTQRNKKRLATLVQSEALAGTVEGRPGNGMVSRGPPAVKVGAGVVVVGSVESVYKYVK